MTFELSVSKFGMEVSFFFWLATVHIVMTHYHLRSGYGLFVVYGDATCAFQVMTGSVTVTGLNYSADGGVHLLPNNKDSFIHSSDPSSVEVTTTRTCFLLEHTISRLAVAGIVVVCSKHSELALTLHNQQEGSLMVDLNPETDVISPRYTIGTLGLRYYQVGQCDLGFVLEELCLVIRQWPGLVIVNCGRDWLESQSMSFLRQMGVSHVVVDDNDKLFCQLRGMNVVQVWKVKWPLIEDRPLNNFGRSWTLPTVSGVLRSYHLPPLSCLPIGSRRLLTPNTVFLDSGNPVLLTTGFYGLARHLPDWVKGERPRQTSILHGVVALIVKKPSGIILLAGAFPADSDAFLVSMSGRNLIVGIGI